MIDKELFCKTIDNMRSVNEYHDGLNEFFRKRSDVEGYLFQPDCMIDVINLLHFIFGDADEEEWIDYYCFELDFGKKWKPGNVTWVDTRQDIKLQTAEDLYELLMENRRKQNGKGQTDPMYFIPE